MRRGTVPGLPSRASRRRSRSQLRTREAEQDVPGVSGRVVDYVVEQLAEHATEVWPRPEADLDQIVAADRKVSQAMRLPPLPFEHLAEASELLEIVHGRQRNGSGLPAVVRFLVIDELKGELVAVLREEAARADGVALADLEHVVPDDADHAVSQGARVAQPQQRGARELAPDLLVAPVRVAGLRALVE